MSDYLIEIELDRHVTTDALEALVTTISDYFTPSNTSSMTGPPRITMVVPADTLRLAVTVALAVVEPVAEPTGVRAGPSGVSKSSVGGSPVARP